MNERAENSTVANFFVTKAPSLQPEPPESPEASQARGLVVIEALRASLVGRLRTADLGSSAQLLGMSSRTLQRVLHDARTSFREVLADERIKLAQELLSGSRAKTAAIAAEVGCASAQHFSTLFRRQVGEPPSVWRRRQRMAGVVARGLDNRDSASANDVSNRTELRS